MTSENRDYYQILGVPSDASFEDIRAAFRERARDHHPDRNPSPDAVDRMQEVNEAYEVLRDEQQRAAYDRAHQTFAVSEEELERARLIAAAVLGNKAQELGFRIGSATHNQWTENIRGPQDVPTGIWHAAFEAAIEAELAGKGIEAAFEAAAGAVARAFGNDTARKAYRHELGERSLSEADAILHDLAVSVLGDVGTAIGMTLGRDRTARPLPASAWSQAFVEIRTSLANDLSRLPDSNATEKSQFDYFMEQSLRRATDRGFDALSLPMRHAYQQAGRRWSTGTAQEPLGQRTVAMGRGGGGGEGAIGCGVLLLLVGGGLTLIGYLGGGAGGGYVIFWGAIVAGILLMIGGFARR